MTRRRLLPVALLALAGGVAAYAGAPASPSPSPSPSPPARKPAPSYTEEDLKRVHDSNAPQSLQATGMPAAPTRKEVGGDEPQGATASDEDLARKRWERRGAEARKGVADAEKKVDAAQKEVDRLSSRNQDLGDLGDPYRDLNRRTKLTEAQAALEQAKAGLAAARKAYDDLQDEARRAQVPQGWVR